MQVRFEGGPLDGQVKEVADDLAKEGAAIYWPPDRPDVAQPDVPGDVGIVEYLSRGDGTAAYVSGVLPGSPPAEQRSTPEPGRPPAREGGA
jgi:hypothetical protein